MSSNSGKDQLVVTAIASAVAGAAMAIAAIKLQETQSSSKKETEAEKQKRQLKRTPQSSIIYAEPNTDQSTKSSSDVVFPHNHEEKMRRRIASRVAIEEDNLTPRNSVTVRVPATSANMGPGCKSIFIFIFTEIEFCLFERTKSSSGLRKIQII